ncbi:RNA exonuclease 5 isoform X2 [Oryzias melastigma]|uniref:RNA exonuclease 5 n=2 Tax=Oryzias melastigma TaxID=30732 RepID=A0A3B3CL30_ORYME|nr:RNA exonuclease 5 isoform X2 [Oryzias melastigma]
MESSSSIQCSSKKRQIQTPAAQKMVKRPKTELEEDVMQPGPPPASPRVSVRSHHLQQPLSLSQLAELIHFAALGKSAGLQQPSWCRLRHHKKVTGVNIVIVEGVTQNLFYKNYLMMKHLRTSYSTRMTFASPPNNVASGIFSSEVPKVDLISAPRPNDKLKKALKNHPVVTKFGMEKKGLTAYLLTQEERIKSHYPVKGFVGFEDFLCTDSVDCVSDCSPLYGLDCEMCLTEKGYELTRVSLVDSCGKCIMDELVKPQNRVLNYLTKFSGITAAMLRPITTTLREVQHKLRELLPGDAVLVGHSLNNDLAALKVIHPHVIDTSLLYKRELGQKFKLKVLAETILDKKIQTEEREGHDPIEDAAAALELAQYFIERGPCQVVELHLEDLWGYKLEEEPPDCTSILTPSFRFADVLQTLGRSVTFLGKRADISLDLSHQQWFISDKEMLASFKRQTKKPFLSVLQFSSFLDHMKRCFPDQQQLHRSVCAHLRGMCVVFAGPFPAGFSEKKVKRLFGRCGAVRRIQMLNTSVRVHAEVEYELLEGAVLALRTLNGLNVKGQPIKVQRPLSESTLDLDLHLDALEGDPLSSRVLYAVLSRSTSTQLNGHSLNGKRLAAENGVSAAKINGQSPLMSEESVRDSFSRFGAVKSITVPEKSGKCAKHAFIKFGSPEGKEAAVSSSEDLQQDNYLICPSLTPPHLVTWVAATTTSAEGTDEKILNICPQETPTKPVEENQGTDVMMKKLDRQLGKVFRSLPDVTLSVVLLVGAGSMESEHPGLCLLEVKQTKTKCFL